MIHDAVGNLTNDGEHYKYVYDAFGRLRKVLDRSDDSLVAEYKYNGIGYRISVHQDTDADDDVDGNDKWFHFAYDEKWRIVATFRESDTDAKEAFVHHAAGLDGSGGSSYIDSVILRDRDANTAWTAASDGTLEERGYLCQNWRADLVALISDGRRMAEWAKYSAYGVPFGLPAGDTDSDGDCDATDITQIQSWIDAPAYDVRGDLDLDGDVDATDKSIAQSNFQGVTLGWDALSDYGNRHGYAGYEYDQAVSLYHVRNRVLDPHLGRWLRRDPLGYVDGMSLYEYVGSRAVGARDPMGESVFEYTACMFRCAIPPAMLPLYFYCTAQTMCCAGAPMLVNPCCVPALGCLGALGGGTWGCHNFCSHHLTGVGKGIINRIKRFFKWLFDDSGKPRTPQTPHFGPTPPDAPPSLSPCAPFWYGPPTQMPPGCRTWSSGPGSPIVYSDAGGDLFK